MTPTPLHITPETRRRFLTGLHGLYPGRRWRGKDGIMAAIHAIGGLQLDPLNVIARSHDITMYGRVADYRMDDLDTLMYSERRLFDWGGVVLMMPIETLPFWRVIMERRKNAPRYRAFVADHGEEMAEVLARVRAEGPLASADFERKNSFFTTGYRTSKSAGMALYQLWLTGELMTHSRRKNQRLYDLTERVAPPEYQHISSVDDAEAHMTRLMWTQAGLMRVKNFATQLNYAFSRAVSKDEAAARLHALIDSGQILPVTVEGEKEVVYAHADDYPHLETLHAGGIPADWSPLDSTTSDEVTFLSPLDNVSARGRAAQIFDFEYIWEVYKPAEKRRWGYYTIPALYQDKLVARMDSRLDRATGTMQVLGLWLEPHASMDDAAFGAALVRGLRRFAAFAGVRSIDVSAVQPDALRAWLSALLG